MKIKDYVKLVGLFSSIFVMSFGMSEAFNECGGWCTYNYTRDFYMEATSENSADIAPYFVYINHLNRFGRANLSIETDAESGESHIETHYGGEIDIQPDTLVMCATSLPVVTFVDANGNIVAQKGLAAGSQITLTGYETQGLIMPNKNIVLSLPEVCSDGYEKNARGECVARNGWYKGDSNLIDRVCLNHESIAEEGEISVYKNGNLMLNVKSGTVAYNNDMNTCGEGYHIFTYEDLKTMFDIGEEKQIMFDNDNYDTECIKRMMSGEWEFIGYTDDGFPSWHIKKVIPHFRETSENSMGTIGYIYDENQNQFGQGNISVETDAETGEGSVAHSLWNTTSTIQTEDQVLCASYYPIATFIKEGEVIEQKPIPAGTTIGLTGYSIIGGVTTMPAHNTEFVIGGCADGYHEENNECIRTKYTVTFETNGGSSISGLEIGEGDKLNQSELVTTRDGFTFGGWYVDAGFTTPFNFNVGVDDNVTLYAKWNVKTTEKGSGYSGGGGSSSTSKMIKNKKDEAHNSAEDEKNTLINEENIVEEILNKAESIELSELVDTNENNYEIKVVVSDTSTSDAPRYSQETIDAYNFAYKNGITSKSTIKEAKMNGNMTRIQMSKMLSKYAINVLGYKPDTSRVKKFVDVTDKLNKEYDDAVTLSYQLGIMGINVPGDRFRPNDIITRAEFATALSRMLYRIADGTGKTKYYRPHIVKLYQEGIISKTSPSLIEKRGYVMLMLMRSAE